MMIVSPRKGTRCKLFQSAMFVSVRPGSGFPGEGGTQEERKSPLLGNVWETKGRGMLHMLWASAAGVERPACSFQS